MYLKDVLDFYELDENSKFHKKEQIKRLYKEVASVAYGNTMHLLDVIHDLKRAWDSILDTSIKNAFKKAKLMTLEKVVNEKIDLMAKILHSFESLNISIDNDELEKYIHVDNENNKM